MPVRRFLESQDPCWKALLGERWRRDGEVEGSKAFVEVLLLCREWGVDVVAEAVRKAPGHEQVSVGSVRFYLRDDAEQEREQPGVIDYAGPSVYQGSAADYADLGTTAEVCHD